ncbi:hypothetical protein [Ruminococcus flavefaciens]|uniref:Uncharacterized protein n=1 Tax=Ruminococcus flavefaciens TaxID=1265 RepID=A0A1K1MG28_RUMFL|nr:hypothetical protein [Ruminococcus flavefaciens]SFW22068.1 hypothetical protein SAMN02910280_1169 [Ruminococcus flavefaciens]
MSFDFDISVRIKEKRTGDIISGPKVISASENPSFYSGFVEVCWWNSSIFMDLPPAIFRICGKYMEKQYPLEEGMEGNLYTIVPRIAMREVCSYIYSRCYVLDSELTEERDWSWRDAYEVTNIARVEKLRDLLSSLDYVDHRNQECGIAEDYIGNLQKKEEFKSNPQGYEFEFMLDYHYCRPRS